jgi:hypothetical protein
MANTNCSVHILRAHPHTPRGAVRGITAGAERLGAHSLRFRYVLEAELRHLRIPPAAPDAGRADQLWAHTCFEAFVGFEHLPDYVELNFAPSGQWAAYRFQSYRQGMVPAALEESPRLARRDGQQRLELQAEVKLGAALHRPLRIGLSAVVEDAEGRLSYWALRHAPGRPDFHHRESFSLALDFSATP